MKAAWLVLMDPLAISFASCFAIIALMLYFMSRTMGRVSRRSPQSESPPPPPAMTLSHIKMEGFQVLEVYPLPGSSGPNLLGAERVRSKPAYMAKIRHPETGEVCLVKIQPPRPLWKE